MAESADYFGIKEQIGTLKNPVDSEVKTNVDKNVIDSLNNIIGAGVPGQVKTGQQAAQNGNPSDLPDYMEEFKEILAKPFEKNERNYQQEAIRNWGQEYANITDRDDFINKLFIETHKENYLKETQGYRRLQDIVAGNVPDRELLSRHAERDISDFEPDRDAAIREKVNILYEGDKLTPNGKNVLARLQQQYKADLSKIEQNAEKFANDQLTKLVEFRTTLKSELANSKVGSIKLTEEMAAVIEDTVLSGKLTDWLGSQPSNTEELAKRQIKLAIVSNDHLFSAFINAIDERGIKFGENKQKRAFIKSN